MSEQNIIFYRSVSRRYGVRVAAECMMVDGWPLLAALAILT